MLADHRVLVVAGHAGIERVLADHRVLVVAGQGLNVCWLITDRMRRGYKAQLPPPT